MVISPIFCDESTFDALFRFWAAIFISHFGNFTKKYMYKMDSCRPPLPHPIFEPSHKRMHCDQFTCSSSVAWLFYNQLYSKIFPILTTFLTYNRFACYFYNQLYSEIFHILLVLQPIFALFSISNFIRATCSCHNQLDSGNANFVQRNIVYPIFQISFQSVISWFYNKLDSEER